MACDKGAECAGLGGIDRAEGDHLRIELVVEMLLGIPDEGETAGHPSSEVAADWT
jgi:hypothetical protein